MPANVEGECGRSRMRARLQEGLDGSNDTALGLSRETRGVRLRRADELGWILSHEIAQQLKLSLVGLAKTADAKVHVDSESGVQRQSAIHRIGQQLSGILAVEHETESLIHTV